MKITKLPPLSPNAKLWVGYSGGLDSTVLLHWLSQQPQLRGKLVAIHVHHGLSANADAWLKHCQAQCHTWQLELVSAKVTLQHCPDGIEAAARQARYAVYQHHCQAGDVLALAQHGDDQIETFMQRLIRGAGLTGLAAMASERELKPQVRLWRPLLTYTRAELETYARQQQLRWVEDESNQDTSYERNWWRNQLLPQLWQKWPNRKASVLRSIRQLGQDQLLLNELLAPLVAKVCAPWPWPYCQPLALNTQVLTHYPEHYWPYLIRGWLAKLNLQAPSQAWLDECVNSVLTAREDAQPRLVLADFNLQRQRHWLYLVCPPSQSASKLISTSQAVNWQGLSFSWQQAEQGLMPGKYVLAPASAAQGLSLKPAKRPRKSIKALFQEAQIPAALRPSWPVLMQQNQLVAVLNVALDENQTQTQGYQLQFVTDNNYS